MLQYFGSCCLFRIMQSNVVYVNVNYKITWHILWSSSKHEEIRLPHEIGFVLILYFIGAILSKTKKCQIEELKKSLRKGGRGDLP